MIYEENWVLHVKSGVSKAIKRFPEKDKGTIVAVIDSLANDPFLGDIQKIKGEENVWRRRTGSYRIFYEIYTTARLIEVFRVERRGSKTY